MICDWRVSVSSDVSVDSLEISEGGIGTDIVFVCGK